jgi:hypothetical protein
VGVDLESAALLFGEMRKRNIGDTILTLGKQSLKFTLPQLLKRLGIAGAGPVDLDRLAFSPHQRTVLDAHRAAGTIVSSKPEEAAAGLLSHDFFFRFLGFETVKSVDYSDYDGSEFVYDLNVPGLQSTVGTYDLIWDYGTIEHIFHLPNFLANIHGALKTGGTIMHLAPSNGMVDHGFYQLSPTFFQDYYATNGYDNIHVEFARVCGDITLGRDYYPHMLNAVMGGGLGGEVYVTRCEVTKAPTSTTGRIPQQRDFAGVWHQAAVGRKTLAS